MEKFYDALDLLKGMIARPSFSREEKDVADYLQQQWSDAGFSVNRHGNNLWIAADNSSIEKNAPSIDRNNSSITRENSSIAANSYDSSKPLLLLNSHIDTVRPVSGWTREAFTPDDSEDDKLYGLGSNDAGASVVALYEAFTVLAKKEQPYNLVFLASTEEEVSGKAGVESVLPLLPPIAFGVVGEPTGFNPAIAEKGLMVLDCIARGRAGHAARDEGLNAITQAIRDIEWFNTYRFPEESGLLGPVKMSVTQIEAGTQHNVIPDRCAFVVDIRSNEMYSNEDLLQIIRQNIRCEATPRSTRLNSSRTDAGHPFVRRAQMLGRQTFGSPTLSDQALMPFPTVKIGPGDSSRSHSADEYIRPSEIREAIDMYIMLLDGLKIR